MATPAARLALQTLQPTEREQSGLLYRLVERYSENECEVPCDHIYALYSLVGPHRTHLPIDYGCSAVERFRAVMDFVHNHERIPHEEVPNFARLLLRLFQLDSAELCRRYDVLDSLLLTVSVAVLGIELLPESSESLRLRSLITPLEPMQAFSLNTSDNADWKIQRSQVDIPYLSGRPDMIYFGVPNSGFIGLAGCRLEPHDQILHIPGTSLVFVVRRQSDTRARIIGTAYIFSSANTPRDEVTYDTWLSKALDWTHVGHEDQIVSLNCTDLLSLIYLATPKPSSRATSTTSLIASPPPAYRAPPRADSPERQWQSRNNHAPNPDSLTVRTAAAAARREESEGRCCPRPADKIYGNIEYWDACSK